jgi:hypothetical protein
MNYDYKILEEKMLQLSPEMQAALTSVEISDKIKEIGNKHDLKLDQEAILFDHTAYLMLGLLPSKDFVKEFSHDAEVDEKKAYSIGEDINRDVLNQVRQSMRQIEEVSERVAENTTVIPADNSSLESAGNFSIEKEKVESEEKTTSLKSMSDENIEGKNAILKDIEDPEPVPVHTFASRENDRHTEPLVDHLLSKPTSIPEEKSVQKVPETPKKPIAPVQKAPTGPDPYREAIE